MQKYELRYRLNESSVETLRYVESCSKQMSQTQKGTSSEFGHLTGGTIAGCYLADRRVCREDLTMTGKYSSIKHSGAIPFI